MSFSFDRIFIKLAGNEDRHKISLWSYSPLSDKKFPYRLSAFIFDWIFVKLSGNEDSHKISDGFDFKSVRILVSELLALELRNFFPWTYNEKNVENTIAPSFYRIIIKLAGKQDNHKSSNEFKFCPLTSGLTCPWALEKNIVDTIAPSVLIGSDLLQKCRQRV